MGAQDKKRNCPMFLSSRSSAPGKLILFGEHAVLYGSPAIATALSGLKVTIEVRPISGNFIWCSFPNFESEKREYAIDRNKLRSSLEKYGFRAPSIDSEDPPAADLIALLTSFLGCYSTYPLFLKSMVPLVYQCICIYPGILDASNCSLSILVLPTELPIASGLGSSAAFSVALSSCLLLSTSQYSLERVNLWSFKSETMFHGKCSGLDNYISTFGGTVFFTKERREFLSSPSLRFLIVDTRIPKQTSNQVAKVRTLREKNMEMVDRVFQDISRIATESRQVLQTQDHREIFEKLKKLLADNQDCLKQIGVSLEQIDETCKLLLETYDIPAKISGAGGGGCLFGLLPDEYPQSKVDDIEAKIASLGMRAIESMGGGEGLQSALLSE